MWRLFLDLWCDPLLAQHQRWDGEAERKRWDYELKLWLTVATTNGHMHELRDMDTPSFKMHWFKEIKRSLIVDERPKHKGEGGFLQNVHLEYV